ncbi:ABC transporter permease [Chitinophaga silvatica]|uniref:ABC transporter permease n=1 Tax=Chitinophaga silvatica TaxID=2282649 RepID=A0A3E1YCS0_9BACT|nr:ABC transporter permease [Chitinophaga silvatica]RFS24058.1 ABC transporter permease [Chitinophaga silvatica]
MIRNYFRVAWRSLQRSRFFTTLNVLGLAFGMAVCMLLVCWVTDEYSTNKFHHNGKNLYRLNVDLNWGGVHTSSVSTIKSGSEIQNTFPEVTANVQYFNRASNIVLSANDKVSIQSKYLYVSSNFPSELDFGWISGNLSTALTQPNSIVLTSSTAKRYFGDTDPVGKLMKLDNKESLMVTGVVKDVPSNSSVSFDFLLPMSLLLQQEPYMKESDNYVATTLLALKAGTNINQFNNKLQADYKHKHPESDTRLWLQSFEDVYLYGRYSNGKIVGGRIEYLRLFLITALIVLLIASINFTNLSTAQASKRAKEVGVRKSIGASRKSLIFQFTAEAILLCGIAALIAGVVTVLLMPAFNSFTGKHIEFSWQLISKFALILISVTLITGVLAGIYPSFVLSRFMPVKVLKGDYGNGSGSALFRKNLVVVQFLVSFTFIVSSAVVYNQMRYIYNRNLGVDRENVMYVQLDPNLAGKQQLVEETLKQLPAVKSFTYSSALPIYIGGSSSNLNWEGKPENFSVNTAPLVVGYDYPQTLGLTMKEGRFFSREFASDSGAYIINETAAKIMGMKDPVGKQISFWRGKGTIVGVVKDFHFTSLHEAISPLVMMLEPGDGLLMIRLPKGQVSSQVASITGALEKINPGVPVDYHFFDETFDNLYQSETMLRKLSLVFAIVAVFISCIGLFGLSVFTAEQRRKEIGIRKVMGASVFSVTALLSKEFLKLVTIGILLAIPLSWYIMNKWLSDFAYHTDLSVSLFVGAGIVAVLIALFTVSYQSVKAALINPVQSLKSE